MGKLNLIILDYDKEYLDYLNKYLLNNYKGKLDITCFTEKELFVDAISSIKNKDVLVVNSDIYDDSMRSMGISCIELLVENNFKEEDRGNRIHKYKDVSNFYEIALKAYFDANPEKVTTVYSNNKSTKILTVYSPIGGCGKSTIAASLCSELSMQNKSVLYINLEDIQGTHLFFNSDTTTSISDMIFDIKEQSPKFIQNLMTNINKDKTTNVLYFDTAENILDIEDLNEDDMKWMLEQLLNAGQFEYVVFDTSSRYNTVYEILLNSSNSVIMPLKNDTISEIKINTFLEHIANPEKYICLRNMYDNGAKNGIETLLDINYDHSFIITENMKYPDCIKNSILSIMNQLHL